MRRVEGLQLIARWTACSTEAIAIGSNAVLVGSLPSRALKLVTEWASLHREELEADWQRARDGGSPEPIDPLS